MIVRLAFLSVVAFSLALVGCTRPHATASNNGRTTTDSYTSGSYTTDSMTTGSFTTGELAGADDSLTTLP